MHALPDERLVQLDLLEVTHPLLGRKTAFPQALDQGQTVEKQRIARVPMAARASGQPSRGYTRRLT